MVSINFNIEDKKYDSAEVTIDSDNFDIADSDADSNFHIDYPPNM